MTVGLAAMCLWNGTPMVVGASDRMITSGDIEYEPRTPKIYPLTNSVVMLIAGDTSAQSDIIATAKTHIGLRLSNDSSWMGVFEVADIVGCL